MDAFITNLIREYYSAFYHIFAISGIIIVWVCITGAIRFGIAVYRRKKGIYPPAASQMEQH